MKKTHITPVIEAIETDANIMSAASNIEGYVGNKNPLNYGGVDEAGEIEASSRMFIDWGDDNEDDW